MIKKNGDVLESSYERNCCHLSISENTASSQCFKHPCFVNLFIIFLFILELCILDCAHGHCHRQQCICEEGWTGELCNVAQCDNRCTLNGQCNNGTCLCNTGWNGKHCTVGESLSSLLLVLLLALCCLLTLSCLLTLCYLGCFLLHSRSWLFAHCWLHACF